ncbi:bifunctional 3-deoxy-7-phosphoheptulonate synthase/chorismate mutase type II [bacterium SCSIO 12741]|nr:bifunctional 3-deoxy-7-phosphoheptulonate synthase/chorismate mutase type II [bacterium SCSIO 12741]
MKGLNEKGNDLVLPRVKDKKPLLIAGPCSAESETQILSVAESLAAQKKVQLFRAGIWKPRTRPDNFEGIGEKGLHWLRRVQEEFGMPAITEVANARHTREALDQGLKYLWIGARTTVNPFSVQDIADALKGAPVTVFVKNPIHPDINLWMGAIERIQNAGVAHVGAIHRGFSTFRSSPYRNIPLWEIPIELQRRFPDLTLICDPSHIAGSRPLIPLVSQKALDLNMAGLMVEVHPNPEEAWSDAKQQLTPGHFHDMVDLLSVRSEHGSDDVFINQLEELRDKIDKLDEEILSALEVRLKMIEQIGQYKRQNNVTVYQIDRWNEILKTRAKMGGELGMDAEFVKKLMELIHVESIRIQTGIMQDPSQGQDPLSGQE